MNKLMKTFKATLMILSVALLPGLCTAQIANPTNAFGDGINLPMQLVDNINGQNIYAIYSGDINQDGTVDGGDMLMAYNDAIDFAFGYNATDLTGDGATDGSDMAIIFNNSNLFLFKATP